MRAISAARFRGAAGQLSSQLDARPDHIGADQHQQRRRRRAARAWPCPAPGSRCGAPASRRPGSRQSAASSAPLASHRSCQLPPGWASSQLTTLTRPSRRLCWLSGLSSGNGGASSRASTCCRVARVAGHDEAAGRGGNAGQQFRAVCRLRRCRPLAGAGSGAGPGGRASGGHRGVLAEQHRQALGPIPGRRRRPPGRRSRWRAWNASIASITSPGSGFRYRCVVDRCAWPITHCRSVSGIAGSRAIR